MRPAIIEAIGFGFIAFAFVFVCVFIAWLLSDWHGNYIDDLFANAFEDHDDNLDDKGGK